MERLGAIFPRGLEGRTVMDCACNCGAYLFWSKEPGAGECFGFDAREHWIAQARFLAEHRTQPSDGMRFEVCDLYDLPRARAGQVRRHLVQRDLLPPARPGLRARGWRPISPTSC